VADVGKGILGWLQPSPTGSGSVCHTGARQGLGVPLLVEQVSGVGAGLPQVFAPT